MTSPRSSSRAAILSRIRSSLKVGEHDRNRAATVQERLASHAQGIIPKRGQLPPQERVDLFVAMAEKYNATVERIVDASSLPMVVGAYLQNRNLPARVRIGNDPRLAGQDWRAAGALEVTSGPSDGTDLVAVSHAFGGIAETGTLCLLSGPDNPVTLTFLPEHHIVVVEARDIAGDMETIWARLRARSGQAMPRTVNMVTGPSRSADIEQTLLLGAHGPRALHIFVVGEPG